MPPLPPEAANFPRPQHHGQRPPLTAFAPPPPPPTSSGLFRMFPPGAPRFNPFLAAAANAANSAAAVAGAASLSGGMNNLPARPAGAPAYHHGGNPLLPPRPPRPYGIL